VSHDFLAFKIYISKNFIKSSPTQENISILRIDILILILVFLIVIISLNYS